MDKNPEVANKDIYGLYIDDMRGNKYYADLLKYLLKLRRKKCKEIHEIHEILELRKIHPITESKYKTIRKQGLDYYFNSGTNYHYHRLNEDNILHPLMNININYTKWKLHNLEVELCYINANIKSISKAIRVRKEESAQKLKSKLKEEIENDSLQNDSRK
jgi:YHS domain-containing protein